MDFIVLFKLISFFVSIIEYFDNMSLKMYEQFLPIGLTLIIPFLNSMNVPLIVIIYAVKGNLFFGRSRFAICARIKFANFPYFSSPKNSIKLCHTHISKELNKILEI